MTTYQLAEQELHDKLLMDIASDMEQGAEFKKLRHKHFFTAPLSLFWDFNKNIQMIRKSKERSINEYKHRYGKDPDIKLAKRLFLTNKKADVLAGGNAGNADSHDPLPEQNDMGD